MEQTTNTVVHRTQRFASQSLKISTIRVPTAKRGGAGGGERHQDSNHPLAEAAKRPSSSATSLVLLGKRSGEDDASTLGVALEEFDLEFHHHVRRGQTNLSWRVGSKPAEEVGNIAASAPIRFKG